MDYKTNILKKELKTEEILLPEIEGLTFGIMDEDTAVFDYTAYIKNNSLHPIDYKVFMRTNKHFIESLAKNARKSTAELFFQNTNGHILIAAELTFLCLAFINPELCGYFNSLLTDVITNGVAYSHGFIYSLAAEKIPSEVMQEIIKERENDTTGSE